MIKFSNITVSYDDKKIFDNFDGKFSFNNLNVLIGKNGIGKSTLLDVISGLKKADSGTLVGIPKPQKICFKLHLLILISVFNNFYICTIHSVKFPHLKYMILT